MSIKVENPPTPLPGVLTAEQLQVGKLYKAADGSFGTVYTKARNGQVIWFENIDRVGVETADVRFVLAPKGTMVTLEQL